MTFTVLLWRVVHLNLLFRAYFSGKSPTHAAPQKKVRGLVDDQESAARSVIAPVGGRVDPNPLRVTGPPKKILTKGSTRATTSKALFTREYCTLCSLNQPPKGVDSRGLCLLYLSLWETEISDRTMFEGNPYIYMHLLNMIIPP